MPRGRSGRGGSGSQGESAHCRTLSRHFGHTQRDFGSGERDAAGLRIMSLALLACEPRLGVIVFSGVRRRSGRFAGAALLPVCAPCFRHRGVRSARSNERPRERLCRTACGRGARCTGAAAASTAPACGCPIGPACEDSLPAHAPFAPGRATGGAACARRSTAAASRSAFSSLCSWSRVQVTVRIRHRTRPRTQPRPSSWRSRPPRQCRRRRSRSIRRAAAPPPPDESRLPIRWR